MLDIDFIVERAEEREYPEDATEDLQKLTSYINDVTDLLGDILSDGDLADKKLKRRIESALDLVDRLLGDDED